MAFSPDAARRLDVFLSDCARATWTEARWNLAVAYFAGEGITRFAYHHLPPLGAPDAGRVRVVATGFPKDWVADYIRSKAFRIDPIPAQALAQEAPFKWSEIAGLRELSEAEAAYLESMRAADLGDGLAIQAFGPGGRNGYFAVGDIPGEAGWDPAKVLIIRTACQFSHRRYCRLLRDTIPAPRHLSDRERELLYWVAQGKSNGVIA